MPFNPETSRTNHHWSSLCTISMPYAIYKIPIHTTPLCFPSLSSRAHHPLPCLVLKAHPQKNECTTPPVPSPFKTMLKFSKDKIRRFSCHEGIVKRYKTATHTDRGKMSFAFVRCNTTVAERSMPMQCISFRPKTKHLSAPPLEPAALLPGLAALGVEFLLQWTQRRGLGYRDIRL